MSDDLIEQTRKECRYWMGTSAERMAAWKCTDELEAARKRIAELEYDLADAKGDVQMLKSETVRAERAERRIAELEAGIAEQLAPAAREWKERAERAEAELAAVRDALYQARREIEYLRHYGNKDCTYMADKAMAEGALDAAIDAARAKEQ